MTKEQIKEKAKEIASKYERWNQEDDESFGAYNGAMEMAEWKDQQFAEALAPILIELDELKRQIKSLLP